MFDNGDHHGHGDGDGNGTDWGQAIFAFLLFRELQSGRMSAGDLFIGAIGFFLVLGGLGLGLLLIVGLLSTIF
ncbi:MAG: hypothetical protein RL338_590 [Chloroflexota bacterium]|jgi:hypothetical protein